MLMRCGLFVGKNNLGGGKSGEQDEEDEGVT